VKKVLVLGSSGMAGHIVTTYLKERKAFDVYNLSHRVRVDDRTTVMDVTDFKSLGEYLDKINPEVVINCIGILNMNAERNKDSAVLLNSYLPHFLESKYKDKNTKVIHISTDCVFSGKTGGYKEGSFRDGDTFYDRTKAIGEIVNDKDLTFRTSIIGPELSLNGIGLFNWFMKQNGSINGYANAIWTGVTTVELAKAIEAAIATDLKGLYHLVPTKGINKYELLKLFKNEFNMSNIEIQRFEDFVLDKSLINTRTDFDYKVPDYETMIKEMREWMENHKEFYSHYGM